MQLIKEIFKQSGLVNAIKTLIFSDKGRNRQKLIQITMMNLRVFLPSFILKLVQGNSKEFRCCSKIQCRKPLQVGWVMFFVVHPFEKEQAVSYIIF